MWTSHFSGASRWNTSHVEHRYLLPTLMLTSTLGLLHSSTSPQVPTDCCMLGLGSASFPTGRISFQLHITLHLWHPCQRTCTNLPVALCLRGRRHEFLVVRLLFCRCRLRGEFRNLYLGANLESPSLAAVLPGLSCGLNVPTQKILRTCCLIVDNMRKIVAVPVPAQGTSLPLGPGGSYGLALGRSGTS